MHHPDIMTQALAGAIVGGIAGLICTLTNKWRTRKESQKIK